MGGSGACGIYTHSNDSQTIQTPTPTRSLALIVSWESSIPAGPRAREISGCHRIRTIFRTRDPPSRVPLHYIYSEH